MNLGLKGQVSADRVVGTGWKSDADVGGNVETKLGWHRITAGQKTGSKDELRKGSKRDQSRT